MSVILQIFGVLFILLIAVGGYLIYRLARFWRRIRQEVQDASSLDTPSRVTLIETDAPAWVYHADLQKTLSELRSMGFQSAGTYDVLEMPLLHLVGMVHPEDYLYAAVYMLSEEQIWTDLCSEQIGRESLTVSNVDTGGTLDRIPGRRQISDPAWGISELYDCIKAERGEGPFKDVEALDFKAEFEQAYAVEMDWRNSRGGVPTWDEFIRIAKQTDATLTDEKLQTAYYETVYQKGVLRLSDECVATFCIETTLTVPEWEAVRDTCFALHEHVPNSHLADFVADHLCNLDDDRIEQLRQAINPALPAIENFDRFNDMLPQHLQAIKLGGVETPVQAEIYASPQRPDSLDVSAS
ncbi:MAG: hypothetical protein ETSY2_32050 [Candidatus Entotheonella gemina]|uniref:Uncharacterized protein n=2 Tax=Candidatus Entotheonella TaxID=93171 RepID=W4M1R2_9BACT|nr:MAG: hypothetical protein ETSY2_32050 [Candidatus Entotheonella gemina]